MQNHINSIETLRELLEFNSELTIDGELTSEIIMMIRKRRLDLVWDFKVADKNINEFKKEAKRMRNG